MPNSLIILNGDIREYQSHLSELVELTECMSPFCKLNEPMTYLMITFYAA